MGPQPVGCGILRPTRCRSGFPASLQWGRSLLAAELRRPSSRVLKQLSFNGAAACWLRNCGPRQPFDGRRGRLQWGRSLLAAELSSSGRWCWRRCPLQWGRSLLAAELQRPSTGLPGVGVSRAAACWRNCRNRAGCSLGPPASLGPQPVGCGIARRPARFAASFHLLRAMGPQPVAAESPAPFLSVDGEPWLHGPQPVGCGMDLPDPGHGVTELQWGRSLLAAEFPLRVSHRRAIACASMGPQPVGCGIVMVVGGFEDGFLASMGPQPVGCGIFHGRATHTGSVLLQWGGSVLAAEFAVRIITSTYNKVLQWGRSLLAAELASPLSYSIFKDLRNPLRAVPRPWPPVGRMQHERTADPILFSSAFGSASGPREIRSRSPLASHLVTKTGYSPISPSRTRARSRVWISSRRR